MIINKMDDTLMRIYEIKDIEEIEFSDLVPTSSSDSKLSVIPCIYVRYDGGKFLNLCINDKYFDVYIKRILEVYNDEKDRIIVDNEFNPFGQKKLKIDEKSKKILESGVLSKIADIYKLYEGKNSYENSFLVQKDEFKLMLPVLTYHVKKLLDYTDTVITFNDEIKLNGYRNNYTINSKVDGLDELLYVRLTKKSEFEYIFDIRSSSNKFKPIRFEYCMSDDFISSLIYMRDYDLTASDTYSIEDERVKHEEIVYRGNKKVINKNEYLQTCKNEHKDITDIDNEDEMKWFYLPWNALYGMNNNVQVISDTEKFISKHNKYVSFYKDDFYIKEYAGKVYKRIKTFNTNEYSIELDEVSKKITGLRLYRDDDVYLICTYFENVNGKNGYYDTYLNRKYYYHLTRKKDKFNTKELISISNNDDIMCGADLDNRECVHKILRRD